MSQHVSAAKSANKPMPAAQTLHLQRPELEVLVAPWLSAGLLDSSELYAAHHLGLLVGESRPLVLLAAALALRAPGAGHTGADLAALHPTLNAAAAEADVTQPLPLPPFDTWLTEVLDSALVGPDLQAHRPLVWQPPLLQTHRMATYEAQLAGRLLERGGFWPEAAIDLPRLQADLQRLTNDQQTSDEQKIAATITTLARTTVISGGPGTGKTTTIRKVLLALRGQVMGAGLPPLRVALAAPTGKAAARMRESLLDGLDNPALPVHSDEKVWLASLQSVTLHKLLGYQPRTPSRPKHNRSNPLPFDVIVVDEASMVDVALMCKLLLAVADSARLVLLGDRNQLASVEAGSVLADVTAGSGDLGLCLPPALKARLDAVWPQAVVQAKLEPQAPDFAAGMVRFTQAFRFANHDLRDAIYALAAASDTTDAATMAQKLAQALDLLLSGKATGLRHVPHQDDGQTCDPQVLAAAAQTYAQALRPLLQARPDDTTTQQQALQGIDAIRVLAAHRKGTLGVSGLNVVLSQLVQQELGLSEAETRQELWPGRLILVTQNDYETGLWNGDLGIVLRGSRKVLFSGPDGPRQVAVAALPPHETAFAMTIHKSQGSQFVHTVVVLPAKDTRLLSRELIYTAISRAKKQLTVCGDPRVLRTALQRRVQRATNLAGLLWPTR